MASITTAEVTGKVATLVLDDASGLAVGEPVLVYGTGNVDIDGRQTLDTVDTDTDTVTYRTTGPDVEQITPTGAVLVTSVTWITSTDVELFVGAVEADTDEADYLDLCTAAANDWCYRRRETAGYSDNPSLVPGAAPKQGTILYAGSLFRQKGSLDNFQSFEAMPTPAPVGSMGEIMRLLGIGRARFG